MQMYIHTYQALSFSVHNIKKNTNGTRDKATQSTTNGHLASILWSISDFMVKYHPIVATYRPQQCGYIAASVKMISNRISI